jgi:hypothetical protein
LFEIDALNRRIEQLDRASQYAKVTELAKQSVALSEKKSKV